MALALDKYDPDWLWLVDDDTIAYPGAHGSLLVAADAYGEELAVLSSRAVWTDGRIHPMNRSRERIDARAGGRRRAARAQSHPLRTGLAYSHYVVWGGYAEFSGRPLGAGHGTLVHTTVVEHRTETLAACQTDPSSRFYYEVGTKRWGYLKSGSFRWWERIMYLRSA